MYRSAGGSGKCNCGTNPETEVRKPSPAKPRYIPLIPWSMLTEDLRSRELVDERSRLALYRAVNADELEEKLRLAVFYIEV
jgi:hypothetical protein